jgi:mRNA-degrading endonuclease RelE of RelBE toxin-antitoxin system
MNSKLTFSTYKQKAIAGLPTLFISLILIICVAVIYFGYHIYKSFEDAAAFSCTSSIQAYFERNINNNEELRKIVNPTKEWKILGEKERNFLFNLITDLKQFDCGRFSFLTKGKTKSGENLQISAKQSDYGIIFKIEDLE